MKRTFMLKNILKIFNKKESKTNNEEDYYPDLKEDTSLNIKYIDESVVKTPKKLPIEALKDRVEDIDQELKIFIEKSSKKKINFTPIFVSLFIFISLGINYYIVEYKNGIITNNDNKDLFLYEKLALLEKQINDNKNTNDKTINNQDLVKEIIQLKTQVKGYEEAINVSTEALMKQRMEIATIMDQVNVLSGSKDNVVLTKDDLTRIALMETNTFKNKEEIDKILKTLNSLTSGKKTEYREDINISKKNLDIEEKELPVFAIYKINNSKNFYIKNRASNKIYEHAISVKDVISNRYEVLDIDVQNGLVIFKDLKEGISLSLRVNE